MAPTSPARLGDAIDLLVHRSLHPVALDDEHGAGARGTISCRR